MENLNEVPKPVELQQINARKCEHKGAKRIANKFGERKSFCMLCDEEVND